nr:hypothetical protein [uncultured Anaeromusa sp.]
MKIEAGEKTLQGRELDAAAAVASGAYCWVTHTLQFSEEMAVKWLMAKESLAAFKGMYRTMREEEWDGLKHRQDYAEEVPCFSTNEMAAEKLQYLLKQQGRQVVRKNVAEGVAAVCGEVEMVAVTWPEALTRLTLVLSNG